MTNKEKTKAQLINQSNKVRRQNSELKSPCREVPQNLPESECIKKIERLELLLNNGPAVIYACKYGGNWAATYISENIKEVFGYEASEFIDHSDKWVDSMHPEDKERVIADLDNLLKNDGHSHEVRSFGKARTNIGSFSIM